MAVWNCGTLEMDCIKGAIELGSECYPCVCEVLDTLWPDDAPNCFKKELAKITKPIVDSDISSAEPDTLHTEEMPESKDSEVNDEL